MGPSFFLSSFLHSSFPLLLPLACESVLKQVAPIVSVAALIYRADGQAPIRHVSIYLVSFLLALLFA